MTQRWLDVSTTSAVPGMLCVPVALSSLFKRLPNLCHSAAPCGTAGDNMHRVVVCGLQQPDADSRHCDGIDPEI